MNSMTSAGPMANTVFMAAPHNAHSVIPESTTQVTMYPHNQPQVNLIPGNQPGLQTPASSPPAQRIFKEGKTLGALQILIGLIHFGLGSIMGTILLGPYRAPSFYGGYPFWGGISFIISGSLSVASEEQPNSPCVLKGGLGMNILSAIFSVMGICLFITDICINPHHFYYTLEKPPGALHCLHVCPLWLPTGLLRHCGLPNLLRVKPSVQPRTSELATILFQ
ncbi:membrane-spanning 4-domains subfamily A member 8-like isoform X2 [Phyllostomus hastatus]|uniref:membrane-spanning 4-domains subfamily A member 8-like isoform X2 n=1 Tax=Phyllostomus hastatus TaxID=9423 RepID=UPI001E68315F|nr:membrane-spanning 4-domains subfamily A member 8-like isoform X2 [Phyllostomus hastatus]